MTLTIDPSLTGVGPRNQIAHRDAIEHLQRLAPQLHQIGDFAWCLVGNGLSNQTFVKGPQGLIAIDSGECVEEMSAALAAVRQVTDEPVVACIYSHFHYVGGTQAILDEGQIGHLDIYAHEGVPENLARFGGEIAPRSGRGLVHQFGTMLPDEGPDALLHCGLGLFYRNQAHAPFTPGYIPATHTFADTLKTEIAGLQVEMFHAPSDATDSITIWFPELDLCVNNLIWPALFNVFAIRGEEYRDPRVLLRGMDQIAGLEPSYLIGTHGPPLVGDDIVTEVLAYRDTIQFMWDQTVRLANKGLSMNDIATSIELPERPEGSYLTREFYGLLEHHVRQIYSGLFGWFDEDPAHLFPLPDNERHTRLIAGFGGRSEVRTQLARAIDDADTAWALELATWLSASDEAQQTDHDMLAQCLRLVAQHTPAANIRNWCLTRALELEATIDLSRHRTHRFGHGQVIASHPTRFIPTLRVLLDPDKLNGLEGELAWHFASGEKAGLRLRGAVAVPIPGQGAANVAGMSHETWADILSGRQNFWTAVEEGIVSIAGDEDFIARFLAAIEIDSLHRP